VLGFAALIAIAAAALLTVAPLGAVLRARAGDVLRLAGRGAVAIDGAVGRSFSETDRSDTPPVALVSSALAGRFLE
jgi:hypothetical protein